MHIRPQIEWNTEKAEKLLKERGIDMNEIAEKIRFGDIITIDLVPNQTEHPSQKMYILNYKDYTLCIPYVYDINGTLFLKTAFPSRTYHKKFGGKNV